MKEKDKKEREDTWKKKLKKRKQRERDEMTEFQGLQRKTDRMTDGVLK